MTTIAFLGLGHMGGPMAANLVAAGHTVRGFDPVVGLRDAAEEKGAAVFPSGAEAVSGAEVVITSLPNGAIVKAVYDEVLPAAGSGALLIDTSTISVDDARDIHTRATERGLAQIDAPVSGGIKGATAGTMPMPTIAMSQARRVPSSRVTAAIRSSPSSAATVTPVRRSTPWFRCSASKKRDSGSPATRARTRSSASISVTRLPSLISDAAASRPI